MSLEPLQGREYGPFPVAVTASSVGAFVDATSDDAGRWEGVAPPGYAAVLLFAAAPAFFADPDVAGHADVLIHSDQRFAWHGPLPAGREVDVRGVVEAVRVRGAMNLVTFRATATDGDELVVESVSTFLMSAAPDDPPEVAEEDEPGVTVRGPAERPAGIELPAPGEAPAPLPKSASRLDLVRYAAASGDFNPIHWDHATAVAAGLPGVIVHGLLMAAWAAQAAVRPAGGGGAPLAEMRLRFRRPLRPAVAARVETVVDAADEDTATLGVRVTAGGADLVTGTARIRRSEVTR